MAIRGVQALPRFSDGWTFLYIEHTRVQCDQNAVELIDQKGRIPVPAAALSVLMLGPGTTVTHDAILVLAESGCSIAWCGDGATRFYASGLGESRQSANLIHQAHLHAHPEERMAVVRRMYAMRFADPPDPSLTIEQVRGMEGVRVREAYAQASRETGIPWSGRAYNKGEWGSADPVNRALSAANACLYGLCHAAIVTTGFSPALGFIHTGKMLSFVYDVADLYKCEVTVPIAFQATVIGTAELEQRVRRICRDAFYRERLLQRIVPDIQHALGLRAEHVRFLRHTPEVDEVGELWDPGLGSVAGGRNFAEEEEITDG